MQLGGGFTFGHSDYAAKHTNGLSIYGDYDLVHNFGIEGDIHFTSLWTPNDLGENTYLLGPRYAYHYHRFVPYAKALFGIGQFQFQQGTYGKGSSSVYGVYAFGGGLDIRTGHHINIRAFDYEYQRWPNFAPNGLSPYTITLGAAYRFR